MSHAVATLNSNNFVVYGQKHKVWMLFSFLERAEPLRQKLSRFCDFFVLQQHRIVYSKSIQETLLSISSKGLGNKTVFHACL